MKIERIERSGEKQERILVHWAEGEPLRITENELLHFGLYAGMELDDDTAEQLRAASRRSRTRARAARMIGARPLSRSELCKRLCEKGESEEDAQDAADWLTQIGALDDGAYAAMLVRHYSAMGYGEGRLRDELHRRGVPRELWEDALAAAPSAEESIRTILKSKRTALCDAKQRQKVSAMLLRRGFAWRDVKAALDAAGERTEEEES